jgi:hypothetical protein
MYGRSCPPQSGVLFDGFIKLGPLVLCIRFTLHKWHNFVRHLSPLPEQYPSFNKGNTARYYFPSFYAFDGASDLSVILEYCTTSQGDSAFDLRPLKTSTLSRKRGANHPVTRRNNLMHYSDIHMIAV